MLEDVTCENHLGREVGGFVQRLLEEHGVEVHGGQEVDRLRGRRRPRDARRDEERPVDRLRLRRRRRRRAARRAAGAVGGARAWARPAASPCSASLETSLPGVYAAGDVAEYDSPLHGRRVRIEHWEVAVEQGQTAARAMLGRGGAHEAVPYFWSDLSDWATLEYVGIEAGEPVVRGSIDDGDFTAFYLAGDGRVVGAATVGRSDDLEHAKRLIAGRAAPERTRWRTRAAAWPTCKRVRVARVPGQGFEPQLPASRAQASYH